MFNAAMCALVTASLRSGGESVKPTLLVLAAGLGKRYGGLKQMDGVGPNGETLLEYAVFDALEAGFGRVVFVLRGDFKEAFFSTVASRFRAAVHVDYALQELHSLPAGVALPEGREKPWGTGHAVLVAKRLIDAPFVIVNADDFYGRASFQLAADFVRQLPLQRWPVPFGMVAFRLDRTLSSHGAVSRGVCEVDEKGLLRSITEHPRIRMGAAGPEAVIGESKIDPLDGNSPTSMNCFICTPDVFGFLEDQFLQFLASRGHEPGAEFYLPEAIGTMIRRGQATVEVLQSPETWLGVTYPEDRAAATTRLAQLHSTGIYPPTLWR